MNYENIMERLDSNHKRIFYFIRDATNASEEYLDLNYYEEIKGKFYGIRIAQFKGILMNLSSEKLITYRENHENGNFTIKVSPGLTNSAP